MRLSALAACASIFLLPACVKVNVGEHMAASDFNGDPKRIFIIGTIDDSFDAKAAASFDAAVIASLARCGVAAMFYKPNSMELDAEAKARAAIASFRPDATLAMRQSQRNIYNGDVNAGIYVLTLHDLAQRRDVWKASIRLSAGGRLFVDRSHAGEDFAAEMVKQMASDRVLKSCPPQAATPT